MDSELKGQKSEFKKPEVSGICRTECHRGDSYEEKELKQSVKAPPLTLWLNTKLRICRTRLFKVKPKNLLEL